MCKRNWKSTTSQSQRLSVFRISPNEFVGIALRNRQDLLGPSSCNTILQPSQACRTRPMPKQKRCHVNLSAPTSTCTILLRQSPHLIDQMTSKVVDSVVELAGSFLPGVGYGLRPESVEVGGEFQQLSELCRANKHKPYVSPTIPVYLS